MSDSGRIAIAARTSSIAELVDLYRTLVSLAGLPAADIDSDDDEYY